MNAHCSTAITPTQLPTLLEVCGVIPTQQRVEIAAIMLSKRQHLSADEVFAKLRAAGSSVSKATVYNTLGRFAECGLLRQVIVDPAKVFYDSNTEPHYHFYNVETGTLEDIASQQLAMPELPSLPKGTKIDGIDVVIRLRAQ